MTDWAVHAARLAEELTTSGKLWSAPWQAAVRAVPRHELVSVHYQRRAGTNQWISNATADDLELVYSNTALFVLPDGLSSTSMPSLMTRMLEALDIRDGHDVLEIGAGSGYNAALLSHRLGDHHVFAVDIEPTLIQLAQERLTRIGYQPTLVTADGANGLPEHAPYHRIIATCSVPSVPWPWVEQTHEGGLILADVTPARQAGNLVLLSRTSDGAEGRFDRTYGSFMAMRRRCGTYGSPRPCPRCEIDENSQVWEAGPHQLWRVIEAAHATWLRMGQPGWERFGLTVRPTQQWVWLDRPDSGIRWILL